jgi:hypothetical protein
MAGDKKILKKLEQVNSEKEEIVFSLSYKGKVVHKKAIEIPDYAKEILDDEDLQLFYFFKDMALKLEDKIDEIHKNKIWADLKNREDDTGKEQ